MPFGGKNQLTPIQAMAHKVSDEARDTDTCSLMTWGYNPYIAEKSPYHGAYLAVVESISKLAAAGAGLEDVYLSFQEFFGKPHRDPRRWGKPLAALLGAFRAQMELGIAAIGGKDSMSGSFEELDVPPTLVSFAVTTEKRAHVISPEFKASGHAVSLLMPEVGEDGLPTAASLRRNWERVRAAVRTGRALAVYTPGYGGVAEAVFKMCLGNGLGFDFDERRSPEELFGYAYGAFVLELTDEGVWPGVPLGRTTADAVLRHGAEAVPLSELLRLSEAKLEPVFPTKLQSPIQSIPAFTHSVAERVPPVVKAAKPRVLIPVFPGTTANTTPPGPLPRRGPSQRFLSSGTSAPTPSPARSSALPCRSGRRRWCLSPAAFPRGMSRTVPASSSPLFSATRR
jgi:phosphoribosylformylglycinamidine synthase